MSRILGIDPGQRRIGLAIAEAGLGIASPLTTLPRGSSIDDDAAAIARVCRDRNVVELVIGLPLHAGGDEGSMAAAARAWGEEIGTLTGLPVTMRDERLTSYAAEQRLGPMPRGRSGGPPTRSQRNAYRARVDREAASIILQDELDARRATSSVTDARAGSR
jgi:putative Holliday junction resolvase